VELALVLHDSTRTDLEEVATFDGGALTLGAFRDHLATLETDAYRSVLDPTRPAALAAELDLAVRWQLAAEQARARGFEVGAAHQESLSLDWTDLARQWAATLGFREGMAREAVKAAALEALRTTGQNAALARSELLARAPLLRRSWRTPE
jgi:hypothetical protein